MAAERCVCLHGHFYQPPRENPWTGRIEPQPSAHPYHNWNERVAAECYAPNAQARILSESGQILALQNNYAHISFDFGPTLLSWMERAAPQTYAAVLEADRASHGAIAQAYHHVILPLANARDRATQIWWGKRDFEHRFGRAPEGMWLPETAANLETLEDLAAADIRFTVLAPRQARRVRRFGSRQWQDVSGGRVESRWPYLVRLPSGRSITVFFYDAGLAQGIAFEGLLHDGARLASRLASVTDSRPCEPQLVSAATDGESYGHHHRFGEMALAAAVRFLHGDARVRLTTYAGFLAAHPAVREAEIVDNSSWSCAHGLERWRTDCGCRTGSPAHWRQAWRAPLRAALDWLRDQLACAWEKEAGIWLWNPWAARQEFINLILDPCPSSQVAFLGRHARAALTPEQQSGLWSLLQLQTNAMLMYTSCGWFFDDISGIESAQILAYAARAVELARATLDLDLEPDLLVRLDAAPSNRPEVGTGRAVYLAQLPHRAAAAGA
ncbi:MAG: DUF3536 domain-containing protein [Terriglobales bacterium]